MTKIGLKLATLLEVLTGTAVRGLKTKANTFESLNNITLCLKTIRSGFKPSAQDIFYGNTNMIQPLILNLASRYQCKSATSTIDRKVKTDLIAKVNSFLESEFFTVKIDNFGKSFSDGEVLKTLLGIKDYDFKCNSTVLENVNRCIHAFSDTYHVPIMVNAESIVAGKSDESCMIIWMTMCMDSLMYLSKEQIEEKKAEVKRVNKERRKERLRLKIQEEEEMKRLEQEKQRKEELKRKEEEQKKLAEEDAKKTVRLEKFKSASVRMARRREEINKKEQEEEDAKQKEHAKRRADSLRRRLSGLEQMELRKRRLEEVEKARAEKLSAKKDPEQRAARAFGSRGVKSLSVFEDRKKAEEDKEA